LVRALKKLIQNAKFVHQLQRRRMNGIASEIAQEVFVLFEN
jgi:hypothetical protein